MSVRITYEIHIHPLISLYTNSPYILAELPANLVLRKIGPRIMLPAILTTWGVIATLQGKLYFGTRISVLQPPSKTCKKGLVTSFAGLATVRAFLGLVEGPMYPGIVLYLSSFYTREELSLR